VPQARDLARRRAVLAVVLIGAIALGFLIAGPNYLHPEWLGRNAQPILYSKITTSELATLHFDPITKFQLPSGRLPNAITVADDGSVWFGEPGLPGVAHLYRNGTLVEYAWPFHYPLPYHTTNIWGIAIWNGGIWSTDQAGNQLVGINPANGATVTVRMSDNQSFPYTVSIGPEGSLWFTEVFNSKIARLDSSLVLHEYPTPVIGTPAQIVFVNATFAYYLDTGHLGFVNPGLFAFNPRDPRPYRIGGEPNLYSPTGMALGDKGIWVTQHGASSLAFYNFDRKDWTFYPTSTISYQKTTLPYFVAVNGSQVWFNEHYANRMAVLNSRTGQLTEYSLSNPPATRLNEIDGALTFTLTKEKVWFTELVRGYVGYVDATYTPNFSLSPLDNESYVVDSSHALNLTIAIQGQSITPLNVQFSDSETISSQLQKITAFATPTKINTLNDSTRISIEIDASSSLFPGDYTLLATVTDGLVYQGLYIRLTIRDV
jgi:streptogramin lyase